MNTDDIILEGGNDTVVNNDTTNVKDADVTQLNGAPDNTDLDKKDDDANVVKGNATESGDGNGAGDSNTSSTGGLEVGSIVEFDGVEYTVDDKGNLIDADGKIFKEAKDVDAFIKDNTDVTNDDQFDVNSIINAVGVNVTDENGNNVEFTNDAAGVKSYLDSVMELRTKEIQEATLNKLFTDAPIVKDFINYLNINNGDYRGFAEIPDRTGIEVDKDNEAQQEAIVRAAAREFNKRGNVDSYIKYLKDSGALFDVACEELQAMKEKDMAVRDELDAKAREQQETAMREAAEYMATVKSTIDSGVIGSYKIPENAIIERDGKKITVTRNDFFDYVSRRDKDGLTGYQRDLAELTDKEVLEKELIDAYLMMNKGSYRDLVNMAIKEENVRKLVLKSKASKTTRNVQIRKPNSNSKVDISDIAL